MNFHIGNDPQREILTADVHLEPGDEINGYCRRLIVNGDLLDIIPWGMWAWNQPLGFLTIYSVAHCAFEVIIIMGNHEGRASWVRELFADYKNVCVVDRWDVNIAGQECSLLHGHQYAPDWRILRIGADDATQFMTAGPVRRRIWYWYCRRRGWIEHKESRAVKNWDNYSRFFHLVWEKADTEAINTPRIYYIGHTHIKHLSDYYQDCCVRNIGAREVIILKKGGERKP